MELAPIDWDDKPGLLESAWRYKRLLIGLFLAGALLGLGLSLLQPTMYEGESHVLLSPSSDSNIEPSRFLLNQSELIKSVTVTDRAARLAGNRVSGETLRERLTTETTSDRDLVTIKVLDPSADGAAQLAEAVGRAYEQVVEAENQQSVTELTTTIERLNDNLDQLDARIRTSPRDTSLVDERTALVDQIRGLTTLRAQLQVSGQDPTAGGVALREPLPPPGSPSQPKTTRNVAAGALLGLLAGFGLAWWLGGRSETQVTTSTEVERALGLPLLARLPIPPRKGGERVRPVMLDDPETVEAEAFRFLRTSFLAAARSADAQVVMVTSATEQEGKSMVAANLALALARNGTRVGLIDLDLRRPAQRRLLELPESSGFTEVALGRVPLARALHRLVLIDSERGARARKENGKEGRREIGFVEVLTAGSRPKSIGELVGASGTAEVISDLRERVDIVLIDAPPMLRVGDALSLANAVDGVLVVTRLNVVRRKSLTELRRLLETAGIRVLGVVANGAAMTDTYTRPYGLPTRPTSVVMRAPEQGKQSGQRPTEKTGQ